MYYYFYYFIPATDLLGLWSAISPNPC